MYSVVNNAMEVRVKDLSKGIGKSKDPVTYPDSYVISYQPWKLSKEKQVGWLTEFEMF